MSAVGLPRREDCAIVVAFDRAANPDELAPLRERGTDYFELRLDLTDSQSPAQDAINAASFAGHPLIVTCRRADEGGVEATDSERMLRIAACLEHASAIDIEHASESILPQARMLADGNDCELIISSHLLQETPSLDWLIKRVEQSFVAGADICKLVTLVRSTADVALLTELVEQERSTKQRPLAVMSMGDAELAGPGRVSLGRAGSLFVFGQAPAATAAGQPKLDWLAQQLRNDS